MLCIALVLWPFPDCCKASRPGISNFLLKYKQSGTIAREKCSGCTGKVNELIKARIEEHLAEDNEMTAKYLGHLLVKEEYAFSEITIF